MRFWNFIVQNEDVELRIDGDIVDDSQAWIYEWFKEPAASPNAFRNELKKYDGKNITLWIDSYGGDVIAAAGIYHALMEHKGRITVQIDGKAMSAASVIAMAGDEIVMNPMSILMIHNPWTDTSGDAKDMRHTAEILDTIKDSIINAYQTKTHKSRAKIAEMMDNETWMSAKVAVENGFADKIAGEKDGTTKNSASNAFLYNRLSFQNSASDSIKQLMEFKKAIAHEEPTTPAVPGESPVNLTYQMQINLNRRRLCSENS